MPNIQQLICQRSRYKIQMSEVCGVTQYPMPSSPGCESITQNNALFVLSIIPVNNPYRYQPYPSSSQGTGRGGGGSNITSQCFCLQSSPYQYQPCPYRTETAELDGQIGIIVIGPNDDHNDKNYPHVVMHVMFSLNISSIFARWRLIFTIKLHYLSRRSILIKRNEEVTSIGGHYSEFYNCVVSMWMCCDFL
jgi:hypothetical protein